MKSARTSTLESWIAGSAPGIAAGDPSPTREGGVPAPFARLVGAFPVGRLTCSQQFKKSYLTDSKQ